MQEYLKSENHPFVALLYLTLLAMAGSLVFGVLGFIVSVLLFGMPEGLLTGTFLTPGNPLAMNYLKVLQIFASVGMFMVPPLIYARIESRDPLGYLKLKTGTSAYLLAITVLLMMVAVPALELTVELNRAMKLPEFLNGLEQWMLAKEQELEVLTKQFLVMKDGTDLAVNLLMIAILPAISEELLFRGCIQRVLTRWAANYHLGIWIAAAIFSAIHVQFYGFLPRMLLGALFGYLLVWSNTMWVPILGHFVNNGATVIAAYVYQRRGMSLDEITEPSDSSPMIYVASILGTALLLSVFYKRRNDSKEKHEAGLD